MLDLPTPRTRELLADPRLSRRFAPPHRLPGGGRTMTLSREYDCLGEEGREMGRVLEEAGREPVSVGVEGMGHGWDQFARMGRRRGIREQKKEGWWNAESLVIPLRDHVIYVIISAL
ncbi:hypothetical protein CALCODRAFT_486584 [Calocera cornea HHB12733]|uniref:Alpha/beta hydrolase fold-3 domain-containing protein n=1 Tax=Calocera cornea HHB12733 TaxID=1353952 RepID=A0A165DMK8_9BASI|nr:hypothetical protein CALCODRAFT_486584 [Calocera cornea HHB12733]